VLIPAEWLLYLCRPAWSLTQRTAEYGVGENYLTPGQAPLPVKVKVKVKFTLEQATKTQRGSRGITLLFLYPRRQMGVGGQRNTRPIYPRERPGFHCIGGWVGPRAGLDGWRKSPPHRDTIPGHSSPYRLSYPGPARCPLSFLINALL